MRLQNVWLVGAVVGLLVLGRDASAAPAAAQPATGTAPPLAVRPPVTTSPRAAAPTPMPVPERTATPVPTAGARPISIEHEERARYGNKLIWWGVPFTLAGALVAGVGVPFMVSCQSNNGDDDCPLAYSLLGIGILAILASSPVWIVGLVKKSGARSKSSERDILPKSRTVVDLAHRRDHRRFIEASGPPAVPVLSYGFRF